jgi:diguanylate cyclase (GGDEF)-like protein
MRRVIAALALFVAWTIALRAATPVPLTTLRAIHALTNAEANRSLPVAFEATVTYYLASEHTMFVQDGDLAIFVQPKAVLQLAPGDRVMVKGSTSGSFRPFVAAGSVTFLRKSDLPVPVLASFQQLIQSRVDCRFVTVRGTIRSANIIYSNKAMSTSMQLLVDGAPVQVVIDSDDADQLKDLLNAEIEITGAESGKFDGKMQQTGVEIHVPSFAGMKILKPGIDPWTLSVTPMDEILHGYDVHSSSQRIRVHGIVTYFQPGSAAVLQNGARSLWIMTDSIAPLRIGDEIDATGFPDVHDGFLTVINGEFHDSLIYQPIAPQPVTLAELVSSRHAFDLVSIEGQVITSVRESGQDEYVIVSNGYQFSAIYRSPNWMDAGTLPAIKLIPPGSKVRVSGICILESSDPFGHDVPFNLLLRSVDDIVVVAGPSLLTVRNLIFVIGLLLIAVLTASARGWILEHRLRHKTATLAQQVEAQAALERRRSLILEDISGSRPLKEILEHIADLVSATLSGAPCWCQCPDGAIVGRCPHPSDALRILREEIPAHSGTVSSRLFVACNLDSKPHSSETEAISMGAGLVALAIETRRLYSDLIHRSQFDQLTEIHNRFALDKHLDNLIRNARLNAENFGLIYIDLDEFKQVNDECGHQVGDLFLQEVAARMTRQVRSVDMLARIGGDEFAVLVPNIRGYADVEEIALRLERSFDEPIAVQDYLLHASASVGVAVFPQDALTKDGLLNAADSAMYTAKHAKKETSHMLGKTRNPDSMKHCN